MKNLFASLVILAVGLGCNKNSGPTQVLNQSPTSTNTLSDSVLYTLTIPSATFSVADTLRGTFTIMNQSATTRTFTSGDSPIFGWFVKNSDDSIVINHQGGVSHHTTTITIASGKDTSFVIQTGLGDLSSRNYSLYAGLLLPPVLSLAFTVK